MQLLGFHPRSQDGRDILFELLLASKLTEREKGLSYAKIERIEAGHVATGSTGRRRTEGR